VDQDIKECGRFLPERALEVGAKIHYTENTLVQQTTAEHLEQELCWESVNAYHNLLAAT
jgi:hypothetical protein